MRAETLTLRQTWPRALPPGSEDANRRNQLTRQVVSSTGVGGSNLRDGKLRAVRVPDRTRASSLRSHIRAVARQYEKLRVHKSTKQRIADFALQTPQTLSLRGRQSKSGHFYVLTLNPLKHVVDTHEDPRT